MALPRPEYPRPQFVRPDWLCLNGEWQFETDPGDSGLERGLLDRDLAGRIQVPFCPEAPLSGVGCTDFMNAVWYRRRVAVPKAWAGRRVLLHFQAVDYDATVWANGRPVGRHRGGFTPFTCDLSPAAAPGQDVTIVLRARDDMREPKPGGKQSRALANAGCLYTRTTGIWQTVWLEPVPETHLLRPRIWPDVAGGRLRLAVPIRGPRRGLRVRAAASDEAGPVASAEAAADADLVPRLDLDIPEARRRLWSPADPHLYHLDLELLDAAGRTVDRAESYAGLRGVTMDGRAVLLNGRPLFQRLVLDQGYYPDGIMTAPSDAALKKDIELSMAAGFNGARLHQKVFEERFLHHADRLGYLVWGEFGDWGWRPDEPPPRPALHQPAAALLAQWLEVLERDLSHPAIVGWCPLNERAELLSDRITVLDDLERGLVLATRAMDPTRPVLDASGWAHRVPEADVFDCHDYDQDPAAVRARHAPAADGRPFANERGGRAMSVPYGGQPVFVSEFGGIWWNPGAPEGGASWGYGARPRTIEEFYRRFEGLTAALLENPALFGYCYTQLTDVYQEQNGIYRFDRVAKFDLSRLRAAQQRPAAVEARP
jgi:beta-galactosidase/beta-glucuronidase